LGQLYFTENSRDWLSEEIPEDKLNRLTQPGKDNFGFPYCHQGNITDQEFGWGRSCAEFTKPIALLGPRNAIFVARHGSWNRSQKFGGDIVVVSLNDDGTVKSVDPFLTGFIEDNKYVGRPADILFLKDGSMLISDDFNGAVYRVSYDAASVGK
jgi:glucose/arabinose dehydrogenase